MEQIIRSFLAKEMLVSPQVLEQLKERSDVSDILNSLKYSLVVDSLDVKEPVKETPKQEKAEFAPEPVAEEKRSLPVTAFQKFVKETPKTEASIEKKEEPKTEIKVEEKKPEAKIEEQKPEEQKAEPTFNHNIKIIKSFEADNTKYGIEDYVKSSNERYEFLKGILAERIELKNPTSINKLDPYNEMSIIGVVKSVEPSSIQIEDPTGSIHAVLEGDQKFLVGDVVGMTGVVKMGSFHPKKIIFPDAPIRRNVTMSESDTNVLFFGKVESSKSDMIIKTAKDSGANYVFVTGKVEEVKKVAERMPNEIKLVYSPIYLFAEGTEPYIGPQLDGALSVSSPSLLNVEGVTLMIYNGSSYEKLPRSEEGILEIMKRRYIQMRLSPKNFLMDSIPDVFYSALDKAGVRNYKGSTLVSADDSNAVLLNLKTRESRIIPLVGQ